MNDNNSTLDQIEALRAEIQRLKAEAAGAKAGGLGMKVSEKGAVSVYGIGRFPVTLYGEQWVRLLGQKDTIVKFIEDNRSLLAVKARSGETK